MAHARATQAAGLADSELDELLETVAWAAAQLLALRGCRIYLRNEASGAFERRAAFPANRPADDRSSGIVRAHDKCSDAIPLSVDGVVDGVMLIHGDGPITPLHRELAGVLASMTAMLVSQTETAASERVRTGAIRLRNEQLRLAIALDEALMAGLALQRGAAELASIAGRLSGRPIVIFDDSWRPIASAGLSLAAAQDVGALARNMRARQAADGHVSIIDGPVGVRGLAIARCPVPECTDGAVVVVAESSSVTALDVHIARRVGAAIAAGASLDRRLRLHRDAALTALVNDIADPRHERRDLEQRARALDVDLDSEWFAVVAASLDDVKTVLESVAGRATMSAEIGGETVILVAAAGDARAAEALRQALAASRPDAPPTVGVSAVCTGAQGCRAAIAAARTAAQQARGPVAPTGVVSESDLGVVQRLLFAPDAACARLFARELLGRVFADGPNPSGRLLETLTAFFECDRSVRRSAQRLGVHENTVRKRLEAVHRLTGLSVLKSADDQLKAQIALAIVASEPT